MSWLRLFGISDKSTQAEIFKECTMAANEYIIRDIGLAEYGRRELDIAETEMPGLMA